MNSKTSFLNSIRGALFQNRFMEETLRQVTRGRESTHWISRLVPNHYQYEPSSLRRVVQRQGELELDLSDLMEWHLYYDFLNTSAENLRCLCGPGDVVFDVGANIGAIMFKLAQQVGETGRVIGFEPDPGRFRKCRDYLNTNLVSNADLYSTALGSHVGAGKIRIRNPMNQGMNQVVPQSMSDSDGSDIVISTLDRFISDKSIERVNLIKIDVEGYETEVIKGAENSLKKMKPRLYIEIDHVNLAQHDSHPDEIYDRLRSIGYVLYRERTSTPLNTDQSKNDHFDLLALPA
jgi:FkbM family methyltransferase